MGNEAPPRFLRLRSGQALRLRAASAVSRDKPVWRSPPHDDDFLGVLKKNIPNKLALMGRSPELRSAVQPRPFDKLRAGSAGLILQIAPFVQRLRGLPQTTPVIACLTQAAYNQVWRLCTLRHSSLPPSQGS